MKKKKRKPYREIQCGRHVIKVYQSDGGYVASIHWDGFGASATGVLGTHATLALAADAARTVIATVDEPRLHTPADIVKYRREWRAEKSRAAVGG